MLTASGLAVEHGDRVLFDDVTLTLGPGRHVALVGANGTGKTTLLEVVVGLRRPDRGSVTRPSTMTIGYLPQDLPGTATGTVLEEVLAGAHEVAALASRLHELQGMLEAGAADPDHRLLDELGEAQARFEQLGGYGLEGEAHRVLAGLGFAPEAADRPVAELSGGWRMRVALARLLLSDPDVLVLDEPTNHLDVDSVAWLEERLAAWPGALLFVSHDRDFLSVVANRVVELAAGTATEYVGDFASFVVQREERLARAEAAAAQQARKVADVERFIDRFRYKATKARQVQSRIKALERLEAIPVPTREELKARFAFPEPQRSSRVVAELTDVSAGYDGAAVLAGVDLVVERGMRLGFVGPNGAGKTTLLRLITGELAPMSGSVQLGSSVDVAHFSQHQAEVLDPDHTLIEELRTVFGDPAGRNIRSVLGLFGFPGDAAEQRVAQLSGGEATRLALAKALCNPVNLLVLDEPTNHLDLPSCDLLEDALRAYPGTILLVTHDRHLLRNVADALVEVRDGVVRYHPGVDEDVLRPPALDGATVASSGPRSAGTGDGRAAEPRGGAGRAREARKALARVERRWERAETEVAALQDRLADPALYEDPGALAEVVAAHERAKDAAAELMAEWERHAEAVDGDH